MKVWELMAALSKRRADADIMIRAGNYFSVLADNFEWERDGEEEFVTISSSAVAEPDEDAG